MTADGLRDDIGRRGGRAFSQVFGRTVLVRLFTLAGTVVLARILEPAEFGTYAIVAAIVGVVVLIGDLGLGASLIQQSDTPSPSEAATVRTLQVLFAVAGVLALWLLAPWIVGLFGDLGPDGATYLRVMSLSLIPTALRVVPGVMLERDLRYGALAASEVAGQGVFYGVAIALALAGVGTWSFIVASVAQVSTGAVLVMVAWRHVAARAVDLAPGQRQGAGWTVDVTMLRRRSGFAMGFQAVNLLAWLRDAVVPLAGGILTTTATVGHLQFAWRTGQLVSSVEDVVARVALPTFSRLQHDAVGLRRAIETATIGSAYLIVPIQLWVAVTAPVLVPFLFGPQWASAIVPLQLVCVGSLFRFPARLLRQGELAAGDVRRGVRMAAVGCAATWALVPPLLVVAGEPGAGVGFVLASVVSLILVIGFARAGRTPLARLGRITMEAVLAAIVGRVVLEMIPGPPVIRLMGSGLATAGLIAAIFASMEGAEIRRIRRFLRPVAPDDQPVVARSTGPV